MTSTNKLEKVQERALRFINNDFTSPISELLKLMACKVYKIVNDLSPQYISDLVNIKVSPYDFRGEKKADIPRVKSTRYGLRSFRSEAPWIWNRLPNNLRVAESYRSSED